MTEARHYHSLHRIPSSPQSKAGRRARRSTRLKLTLPVLVHGKTMARNPFRETTRTLSVSANGALLSLSALVEEGQTLLVENKNTRKEQECRVVDVRPAPNGNWAVGVEFTHPGADFWQIHFPPILAK